VTGDRREGDRGDGEGAVAGAHRQQRLAAPGHASGSGRGGAVRPASAQCGPLLRAALHHLDGSNGVKDFDVWSFYAALGEGPFPYRWRGTADFGPALLKRGEPVKVEDTEDQTAD
jgi:hypothetical protein